MKLIKKIKKWFYPLTNYAITKYYPKEMLELFFLKGFICGQHSCPACTTEKVNYQEQWEELFNSYYKYINEKYSK